MSSPDIPSTSDDKGKSRAHVATENTPLLAGSSRWESRVEGASTAAVSNRRLHSKLVRVFLISLLCCSFVFITLALLAWSYAAKASSTPPGELVASSTFIRYPNIDVLGAQQGSIWVRVEVKLGVDAGTILGVRRDPEGDGFLTSIWKSLGRWGVRRLEKVTLRSKPIHITPEYDTSLVLATLNVANFDVPLHPDPPSDKSWLSDVVLNLNVQPTSNTSAILDFLQGSWARGNINIRADTDAAEISWRNIFHVNIAQVQIPFHFKFPRLSGLPKPGDKFPPFEQLVKLQEFHVVSQDDTMSLNATATAVNPVQDLHVTVPSLPFIVSIPSSNDNVPSPIPIANVTTLPFVLTGPNVTLDVSGTVLPLPSDSSGILSNFLMRYLSGKTNSISISTPLQPDLAILAPFPAPNPRPQLLHNVTIRDMKVKPKGGSFVANGIVFVKLVLPKGIDIALDVQRVFPDVLVFDGEVSEEYNTPPDVPLPDPLPENAFGHIRPDDWLPSLCIREEAEEGNGATYSISAAIVDVPLGVLPGREKQFSNFVSKVIFGSEGATAGILGSASVIVNVEGLPVNKPGQHHELELDGLPFRGSVKVGKKSLLTMQDIVR